MPGQAIVGKDRSRSPAMLWSSELKLVLEAARGELVRTFVREACLCEDVPVPVAGLIADDTAQAWQALCTLGSGRERARIQILYAGQVVRSQIFLTGHSRFSKIAACLVGHVRADAGISWREHGIDGWEI